MNKLFTLVFAACASLSVSAVEKDLVTTPITIEATQGEDGLKWAETEAIILQASDVAVNDFLKLTVTDAEAGSGEQNVLQFKKADSSDMYYGSTFNPAPNSVVTIPVTKEILAQITGEGFKLGGAVQQKSGSWPAVLGKKITVSKISVLPASDFMTLDLSSADKPTTAAWGGGVTIPSANFKLAKAGDVVVVTTTAEDAIRNEGNFQYNMGKLQLSGWNIPMFFVQTLSAADIEKINSTESPQWYYQGAKFPVSATAMLYRQKTDLPSNKTVINVEETALGVWENGVVLAKENFANVQAGDELHIAIKDFKEVNKEGESWTRRGQIQLASADENCPSVSGTIDVFDVSETVVVFDDKIVAAAKEFGLVVKGECLTVAGANLYTKAVPTSISGTVVAPKENTNAPVYNFAGQQVNASYKGVVIKNGKKYVQK